MVFEFGDAVVDPSAREVRRSGRAVAVRPREFDLLVHLLRYRDRAVSKEELIDVVWKGVFVSDSALFTCVKRVRSALDGAVAGETVRSLYGHGYRFVAEVTERERAAAPLPGDGSSKPAQAKVEPPLHALAGRAAELARLEGLLEQAGRGRGRAALLAGEAGIGKTRVADELARLARERGFDVLASRCLDGGDGQAFWPWAQMLRGYADSQAEADVQAVFGKESAELRWLTPAAATVPHASDVAADAALLRTRLFDSIIAVLRRASRERRPLLLVIDDVHWADVSSIHLLAALADRCEDARVLVLATYRGAELGADHPLAMLAQRASGASGIDVIELGPLDEVAIRSVVAELAELAIAEDVLAFVARASEGNPFFAKEIWYHLVEERHLAVREERWQRAHEEPLAVLPQAARAVVARRLARLGQSGRAVVAVASVIGRDFDIDVLRRVIDMPVEALADAVDEAQAAQVVAAGGAGEYRFTHALVHSTAYEELSPIRRALLHRRVAEDMVGRAHPDDLLAIARHYLLAAPAGALDPVVEHAVAAAARAQASLAYEAAVLWLEQARSVLETYGDRIGDGAERARLFTRVLLELGAALQLAGRGPQAHEAFAAAAEHARSSSDAEALARAALGMATLWSYADPQTTALLDEAARGLGRPPTALRARVLGSLAVALYHDPTQRERAASLGAEAVRIARGLGDPLALMRSLSDRLVSSWYADNLAAQQATAGELLGAAVAASQPRVEATARCWRVVNALGGGDLATARAEVQRVEELAEELRDPTLRWHSARFGACLAHLGGDLETAETLAHEAWALGSRVSERAALLSYSGQLIVLRREQGRLVELLPAVEQPAYATDPFSNVVVTRPYLFAECGRTEEAAEDLRRLAASDFSSLPPNAARNTLLFGLSALAEACASALEGDERTRIAEMLYERCRPHRHLWITPGWGIICLGPMAIVVGMLEGLLGMGDEAEASLEGALAACEDAGAPVAAVVTRFDYARMLLGRGRDGDRARALAMIASGREGAERLGLAGWDAKLAALEVRAAS